MRTMVLIIWVTISLQSISAAGEFRPEAEKLGIILEATKNWTKLRNWQIEYDCVITPNRYDSHVHMVMAAGAPDYYYKLKAKGFTGGVPWQDDVFTEESFVSKNVRCISWPRNRIFRNIAVMPGDKLTGTIGGDILWRVVPACPMTSYRLPSAKPLQISPILNRALSSPHYLLQKETESIDGDECFVFVLGGRKTWISKKFDLCLRKDEVRYRPGGSLAHRVVVNEIDEVAPGLWLPVHYELQRFFGSENENRPVRTAKVRIKKCLFDDDVPLSTFIPHHLPGSMQEIRDKSGLMQSIQVVPGGEQWLNDRVTFIKKYASMETGGTSAELMAWSVAGSICGTCTILFLLNNRRERQLKLRVDGSD